MESPAVVQDLLPIQNYLVDWHVRVTWIAFMTLWVLWGLSWFVRNAFGGDSNHVIQSSHQVAHDPNATTVHNNGVNNNGINNNGVVTDPEIGVANTTPVVHDKQYLAAPAWSVNVFNRLNRAHDLLRDLVLMLLSVLTLNTFARASTRGVMIIAWIFVALAFVSFVIEASFAHRYLRLLYTLAFYGLGLAIVGLAYKDGFYN